MSSSQICYIYIAIKKWVVFLHPGGHPLNCHTLKTQHILLLSLLFSGDMWVTFMFSGNAWVWAGAEES